MILNVILWYFVVALAGWLVFPLAYRLLAFLPDRGLTFSRPLGLLLWGYAYWLLTSLHILQNDLGGVFFALLVMMALSAWQLLSGDFHERRSEMLTWLRQHRKLVVTSEGLFLLAFVLWAVVRAAVPDASGTEKPMELAFINAILRSPGFPPSDPWLSGYAISYYYFGYVMVAMLARISATPGAVAFNLGLVTWFALTALAAYGLVYNLLAARGRKIAAHFWALLAPLFVLLVSNLEGFLEMLHAKGLFWQGLGSGTGGQSAFWQWLNIQELVNPPALPLTWAPGRPGGIWWWRASRVLQDFTLNGQSREIIDEFPAFSYVLGDLHPHVLSMPFVLLAIGLALNTFFRRYSQPKSQPGIGAWLRSLDFWLTALVLGGLSFLNTWDFPIYLLLFAAATSLAQYVQLGWRWQLVIDFLERFIYLAIAGVLLYLPFYLGFSSQANGFLPSLVFFTRGVYFWIMFGSLLIPIFAWLVWRWRGVGLRGWGQGLLFGGGLVGGLWLLSSLYAAIKLRSDPGLAGIYGAAPGAPLLAAAFGQRIQSPGTWITLVLLLAFVWGLLQSLRCRAAGVAFVPATGENVADAVVQDQAPGTAYLLASQTGTEGLEKLSPQANAPERRADLFVLLLILLGTGLVLFPEFFYLRDQFGWRMNTIFKFYFQAWIVWAGAAAYASVVLWTEMRKNVQSLLFRLGWLVVIGMALVYPYFAVLSRTNQLQPATWTLNGANFVQQYDPLEWDAIQWLQQAPYGVVAEAVGGSYTNFARVSTFSGLPTVLGWPGHESQWRGGEQEKGSREADIAQMYKARTWDQVQAILQKYNIRYVYIGTLESNQYHPNDALFQAHLKSVFHNNEVTIYEVPQYNLQQKQASQP